MKTEIVRVRMFKVAGKYYLYVQRLGNDGILRDRNFYRPSSHLIARLVASCQQALDKRTARISVSPDGWQMFSDAWPANAYRQQW